MRKIHRYCHRLFFIALLINIIACSKKGDTGAPAPLINSIFPSTAGAGDTITVRGINFPTDISLIKISLNNKVAKIIKLTADSLQAEVPLMAGSGKIEMTVGAKTSTGPELEYKYEVIVTTVAGDGSAGNDNGAPDDASFYCPWGITTDENDNLYVADCYNRLIRKIAVGSYAVSSYSIPVSGGADAFYSPYNIAVDKVTHDMYVTDFNEHLMRMDATGNMSVIYTAAMPLTGIAIAPDRNNLYLTNNTSGTIIKTDMNGKNASVFTSGLITPRNIIFNNKGKMFVAACPGPIYQVGNNGAATSIVNLPDFKGWEIATDTLGNFFLADHFENTIKMIDLTGEAFTIAGNGTPADIDGIGTEASFNGPQGITIDSKGNLYVTTYNYDTGGGNKVRKITIR